MRSLFARTMQLVQVSGTARAQPALAEWFNCIDFHELPVIAIGCRVMSTRNVSLGLGIANGTMGTVDSFRMRSGAVCSIMVIFDGHTQPFPIKRSTTEKAWHEGRSYTRSTFPLTLAYSMTIHKAQGATLAHGVIIHIANAFMPGQVYVALSRVLNRAHLRIVGRISAADIIPIDLDW